MAAIRPPVEVLAGDAPDAVAGIRGDFALLDAGLSAVRVWRCARTAVVLGVSRDLAVEVNDDECRLRAVAVLRRASGGGTVLLGPGTVQYAFVVPHPFASSPPSLDAIKRAGNDAVRRALARAGLDAALECDPSGDLRTGDRKVGGLAMRRHRDATLLHGTLLVQTDLAAVDALLRHPQREPAWRQGRSHRDFLANLGPVDLDAFAATLESPIP